MSCMSDARWFQQALIFIIFIRAITGGELGIDTPWLHSLLTSSLLPLLRLLQSINCGPFHLIHLIANNRRIAMTSTVDVKELIDSCCAPERSSQTSQGIVFVKCKFHFISTDLRYNFLPALNVLADLNELSPQVKVELSYAIIFLLLIDVNNLCDSESPLIYSRSFQSRFIYIPAYSGSIR